MEIRLEDSGSENSGLCRCNKQNRHLLCRAWHFPVTPKRISAKRHKDTNTIPVCVDVPPPRQAARPMNAEENDSAATQLKEISNTLLSLSSPAQSKPTS